jgi:hypothetical protein
MSNTNTTITAGQVAPAVVNLGSTSPFSVNASAGNDFRITLTGSATINVPSNGVDGQRITLQITQPSGSTGAKVTWGAGYNFGSTNGTPNPAPTLSTGGSGVDVIGFIYNQLVGDWFCVGAALGF